LRWEEVFGLEMKDQEEETVRAIQVLSILSRFKRRKWPCFCIRTE
jgi:hypothetical protein